MTADSRILGIFIRLVARIFALIFPGCHPAVSFLLYFLKTESPPQLQFVFIPFRHYLVKILPKMYPVILGFKEILTHLIQDLCESPFSQLYLIVVIYHLRTNQCALVDVDYSADHGLIADFRLYSDVLLIPSHQQPLCIPKLYYSQNYDENCEDEGLDAQDQQLIAPFDLYEDDDTRCQDGNVHKDEAEVSNHTHRPEKVTHRVIELGQTRL